jgi:hypothetical protein
LKNSCKKNNISEIGYAGLKRYSPDIITTLKYYKFGYPFIPFIILSRMKIMPPFFRNSAKKLVILLLLILSPVILMAAGSSVPSVGPVRVEFIIFGLVLLGVALFHKHTFWVAVTGLTIKSIKL